MLVPVRYKLLKERGRQAWRIWVKHGTGRWKLSTGYSWTNHAAAVSVMKHLREREDKRK